MIPIWIVIIITGVTFWLGFSTCALLTIGRDMPRPIFEPTENLVEPKGANID